MSERVRGLQLYLESFSKIMYLFPDDEDPVNQFVTGSHDSTLFLWEWNQQKNAVNCVHACRGHAASVDCVAVDHTKTRVINITPFLMFVVVSRLWTVW